MSRPLRVLSLLAAAFAGSNAFSLSLNSLPASARLSLRSSSLAMSAHDDGPSISRRSLLAVGAGLGLLGGINGIPANAADDKSVIKLKVGLKQLNKLLKDWDEVTTLCNFAEVPRELLETQNKAKLLEKAKVNALFDKEGAMVVKCKRNPVPVRAAMGFNEDPGQPLFRADKTIKQARAKVDPDFLEDYIELEERWSQLQSSIDSMSYGSAMRGSALGDFKQGEPEPEQAKFLESERREITKARDILQKIVGALDGQPAA